MQFKIIGSANMAQVESQFAAITAQVAAMNKELAQSAMIPAGGNPAGFSRAASAANGASRAFNHALASTGAYRLETLKLNDAVSKNTELLSKQKLGMSQVFGRKSRTMMKAVYREQIAMQQAVARVQDIGVGDGKTRMSMGIPTEVHASWDTLNNRIGMFRTQLASASSEMVNWGKNTQWAGRQLMVGISMPVAAFGAAAGVMAYQVDKQMTRIAKVYDTTANSNSHNLKDQMALEAELSNLREAGMNTAVKAAKEYGSSVTNTLEVQAELAATGQTGARLQESTNQVMRIATLGEIEHAQATKALIALQSTLGHTVKQTADDFNYMNSIENATSLSTNDFTEAIPRALGPMKEMGGTLQDLAILMVAMKERGVEAGEGANAIKAMMQRLYRPSRQVREEWTQLAGVDPLKFVEESGGNVMEILPKIAEATKDLDKASRVKLLAGLFGTYQVTRMSAMLKGLDDMKNGIGQTSRVLEVNNQTMQDWANTAERELATQAESASGRFIRAWEGMKAELADIGKPFLEVASRFMSLASSVVGFVNNMPGWAKKGLIFGAMLAALVGPVVMLIGLFANFAGNMGKFVSWALRAVTSFEFMNKAQWAARVSAELAEHAFMKEATAGEVLENQLRAIALAAEYSTIELSRLAGIPLPVGFMAGPSAAGKVHGPERYQGKPDFTPLPMPVMPDVKYPSSAMTQGARASDIALQRRTAEHLAAIEYDRLRTNALLNNKAEANQVIQERTRMSISAAGVSTGLMVGSMAAMALSSGETANNIAQFAMLASIAVPAVQMLVPGLGKAGTRIKEIGKGMSLAAKKGWETSKATASVAGKGNALISMASGMGKALMGPWGWAALAATGLVFTLYKVFKHEQKITAEKEKQNRALYEQNNLMEDALNIQARTPGQAGTASVSDSSGVNGLSVAELTEQMESSEEMQAIIDKMKTANTEAESATTAMQKYVQVLTSSGGSAEKAQLYVEALFRASGSGALEAQIQAQGLRDTLGSFVDVSETSDLWSRLFSESIRDTEKSAAEQGKGLGEIFSDSIYQSANSESDSILDGLTEAVDASWQDMFSSMDSTTKGWLSDFGTETGSEFNQLMQDYDSFLGGDMSEKNFKLKYDISDLEQAEYRLQYLNQGYGEMFDIAQAGEAAIVAVMKDHLDIAEDITTLAELRNTWEWKLQTATKGNAKKLYQEKIAQQQAGLALAGNVGLSFEMTEAQKLYILNQVRVSMGLSEAKHLSEGFRDSTKQTTEETKRLANAIKNLPVGLIDLKFSRDNLADIRKTGIEDVMGALADRGSEAFSSRMDAALSAAQEGWDNQQKGLEDRQERQMDRFENRYERMRSAIENRYDAQLEGIDKTIKAEQRAEEIRQRIFEAEQSRLDRLTESANRTIDFNMALQTGDLDEAAKIRNDMDAAAQGWALSDAAEAGGTNSEKRIDTLENTKENIEKRKEAELKALEAREAAERKHLEKIQEMQSDALDKQAKANMDFLEQDWSRRKDARDAQLELLASIPIANQKQLEKALDLAGLSIKDFGFGTSEAWGKFFKNSMSKNTRLAGLEIAKSSMWEALGNKTSKEILFGMGFGSMAKFKKFIQTGILPEDFGNPTRPNKPSVGNGAGYTPNSSGMGGPQIDSHGGGFLNQGGNGRAGVARTLKGTHPNEIMVRAQKQQFLVNADSAKKYGPQLEAINKGIFDSSFNHRGEMGGAGAGIAGLMSGALSALFTAGVGKAMINTVKNNVQKRAAGVSSPGAATGSYVPGTGGTHVPIFAGSTRNLHGEETGYPAYDFAAPRNTPIYAVANGVISRSYDIKGPLPTDTYNGDGPYGSYGRVIYLKTDAGPEVLYAHLNQRSVEAGQRVQGGAKIGLSGNTGNSSGAHLHFGATNGPLAWLKTGGMTLNDGMAMLHRGETVLTKPLTDDLKSTVQAFGKVSRDAMSGKNRKSSRVQVDPNSPGGFWTYISGMVQAAASKAVSAPSTDTGSANSVRSGTYNVLHGTSLKQSQADLTRLMGGVDVLSLQEMGAMKGNVIPWIKKQGWGFYQGGDKGAALAWNKETYTASDLGNVKLANYPIAHNSAMYGKFTPKNGGRGFYQASAHTIWKSATDRATFDRVRMEQYASLANLADRLGKGGTPLIMGGDFNMGSTPIAMLERILGMKSNRERGIDHLFYNSAVRGGKIGLFSGNSDHDGVLSNFDIPGLSKGAMNIDVGGLARLHEDEGVLTKDLNSKFKQGVDNFASGASNEYNVTVNMQGSETTPDEVANVVITKLQRMDSRRPTRRRS